MSRGGVLLAVALTLALSPAAAAGQTGTPPDLVIVGRQGNTFTGDDVHNDDGVGQQRSVIVDHRTVLVIRLENDGTSQAKFVIAGTSDTEGFRVRYLVGTNDVTAAVTAVGDTPRFGQRVRAHASKTFRVVIEALPDARLGSEQTVVITATGTHGVDTVKIDVTKVSTPTV